MLANAIIVVIGFNDIAIAGFREKSNRISKNRQNGAACHHQVNSPLWEIFLCANEMLLEQCRQGLLCWSVPMRLRLRDATAVTELRVQSHLRQCQKWHYQPQDGGQPKNGSPFNDKAGVLDHECSASLLLRQYGRVACTSLRSGSWAAVPETQIAVPSRKTEAVQRMAHQSEEDQCTIPRVLSIVAVAPMWSCRMCTFVLRFHAEDLMASPVYRRRLDDAEKSLPVPTKVKRETFRTIRTSRDGGSRCNGPQTPARP
jgi:hypothetical protein